MAATNLIPSKTLIKNQRKHSQINRQHEKIVEEEEEEAQSSPHKKTKLCSTWNTLDLILSLQKNTLENERKIELAFDFVTSDDNVSEIENQTVSIARLASFLSDWIQPLLIPHEKSAGFALNYRCWVVFKFCLQNSLVAVSLNLLKAFTQVLSYDNFDSVDGNKLLETLVECVELIFSSNARVFYNASMDVWRPCIVVIADSVREYLENDMLTRLSCLILEHFANFLRFHKDPATTFSKFVAGLLEPLLEFLVLLHIRYNDGTRGQVGTLLLSVEDVLSNGIFHSANISGFFTLRSSNTEEKLLPKGHRDFLKKMREIIIEKKVITLQGFGYLYRLFVTGAKSQKRDRVLAKCSEISDEHKETNKPIFEVFVKFMQPLLLECKIYSKTMFSESGRKSEDSLLAVNGMLKAVNESLVSFIKEKVYLRTEDTSEGAHYNFLKEVYDTIVSISIKLYQLWLSTLGTNNQIMQRMLSLAVKEVVSAIGYLLETEYKVVEDDITKLWLLMFSFLVVEHPNFPSQRTSGILNLGCKLINIYNELREVVCPLFALCKAVRLFGNAGFADVLDYSLFSSTSLSSNIYIESVDTLLCSQEFLSAISNSIKSIPEGQASECIQQLEIDITHSLQWMRTLNETDNLNLQTLVLGRLLSKIYTTVFDSLTVTATNSISIEKSIKSLMGALGLSFSNLVQRRSGSLDEFIYSVTGRRLSDHGMPESDNISWIFVFFFRLYSSCRSLYRQLISLMPPDSSLKAAKSMGIFYTVARENDWKEKPETIDEGYFSWIVKPSISLLDLFKFHLEDYFSSTGCPALLYVARIMILQRLSDLNQLIKGFEFFQERDTKKSRKIWKKFISAQNQEAKELTNFMLGHKKIFVCKKLNMPVDDAWDMDVCSLNERSLCTAIWKLLCHNIDIWCAHSTEKHLKKFLSCLFLYTIRDVEYPGQVTMKHISLEFLTNIVSYEQSVLHKHFISGFCCVLEKLLSPILSNICTSITDLGSLPPWSDFLNILKKESSSDLVNRIASINERQPSMFRSKLKTCESLLNLLSKVPKVHIDAKSLSSCSTYVLNLERLAVYNLLNNHGNSSECMSSELIKLFVSCRRVMKYLVLASIEVTLGAEDFSVFSSSDSILWLLKSVSEIVKLPHGTFEENYSGWVQDAVFPLIDHTSYLFLAISEGKMNVIKSFLNNNEELNIVCHMEIVAEILKEQLISLGSIQDYVKILSCSQFATSISCFQGFLWGLVSSIDSNSEDVPSMNAQFYRLISSRLPKFVECITFYEDTINQCFSIDDDKSVCASEGYLVRMLLNGGESQIAFTLRQLFNASAAIFKLKSILPFPKFIKKMCASSIRVLLEKSVLILMKTLEMVGRTDSSSFIWIDGVLTFLEVIGISNIDLNLPENFYIQLIDTYMMAIGKCISLQGKSATLSSRENMSSIKMLKSRHNKLSANGMQNVDRVRFNLNTFKARLRVSFKKFVNPTKFDLSIALQSLEKILVGVHQGCNIVYEINTGNMDGGEVSSTVAAGIECLNLVFESLSGNDVLKGKILSFINAVFNIIIHLQNSTIFHFEEQLTDNCEVKPDAGAVILMCVEILTNIVGNPSFWMDTWYVSQCLHVPFALFHGINRLKNSKISCEKLETSADVHGDNVDHKFSVDLYASCCRLLCATLKHRKRHVETSIAVLEESVSTLLDCLEMVDTELISGEGYFTWETEEAIKCASYLRRIYEEIRQQKDDFAEYSLYFLSNYISTYSGCGPLKAGIKREIDEALRPGIYSLIDACDKDDLRQLHISLGEGPCRNTLKALMHDYQVNFQYEGKI